MNTHTLKTPNNLSSLNFTSSSSSSSLKFKTNHSNTDQQNGLKWWNKGWQSCHWTSTCYRRTNPCLLAQTTVLRPFASTQLQGEHEASSDALQQVGVAVGPSAAVAQLPDAGPQPHGAPLTHPALRAHKYKRQRSFHKLDSKSVREDEEVFKKLTQEKKIFPKFCPIFGSLFL